MTLDTFTIGDPFTGDTFTAGYDDFAVSFSQVWPKHNKNDVTKSQEGRVCPNSFCSSFIASRLDESILEGCWNLVLIN